MKIKSATPAPGLSLRGTGTFEKTSSRMHKVGSLKERLRTQGIFSTTVQIF